jgi:hypothetical protein
VHKSRAAGASFVELFCLQNVSIQHCRAIRLSSLFNSKAGRVALAGVGKAVGSCVVIMFTCVASSPLIVHACCTTQPRSNHHIHHLIALRRPLVLFSLPFPLLILPSTVHTPPRCPTACARRRKRSIRYDVLSFGVFARRMLIGPAQLFEDGGRALCLHKSTSTGF